MRNCRLCRLAAVLARGHSNSAGGEASGGVSTAGDCHRAGRNGGVCCGGFRVVRRWDCMTSWVRLAASGPLRSACGLKRRLGIGLGRVNRRLRVGLGGIVNRRLAPARVYNG